jgi:4-hydroxybenzoate polyprenyltransferase
MEKIAFKSNISQLLSQIQQFLFGFVKYRIHISLIFFFLLLYNNSRYESEINYSIIFSFTLWHFALFLFDRVYDRKIDKLSQPDEYVKDKHSSFLYFIVGFVLLASLMLYLKSGFRLTYWFILLPITFLYPLKAYKNLRIKSIFFVKNFYSAFFIFCLPLVIQLHLISEGSQDYLQILKPILSLLIYVLIGEVFWDIRDTHADKLNGTITIPNKLGLIPTKIYMLALILTDAFFTNQFFSTSAVIYIILLTFVKEDSHRLIFHLPPLIALIRFML